MRRHIKGALRTANHARRHTRLARLCRKQHGVPSAGAQGGSSIRQWSIYRRRHIVRRVGRSMLMYLVLGGGCVGPSRVVVFIGQLVDHWRLVLRTAARKMVHRKHARTFTRRHVRSA
jgi:hypothetical protein